MVKELRALLKDASELYLATDEDREGEAISWHLLEVLKPKVPVKRMVFHEITQSAIDDAVAHPRDVDYGLVDAEETRRILDRLFGYAVSPVLWRRVNRGLSAGRVQSPADAPRRRAGARAHGVRRRRRYWDLEAAAGHRRRPSPRRSSAVDGAEGGEGKDFGADGQPEGADGGRPRRGARRRAGRRPDRPGPHRPVGRGEALPVRARSRRS